MVLNIETPAEGSQRWQDWQLRTCIGECCAAFLFFSFFFNPAPEHCLKYNNQTITVSVVTSTTSISKSPSHFRIKLYAKLIVW